MYAVSLNFVPLTRGVSCSKRLVIVELSVRYTRGLVPRGDWPSIVAGNPLSYGRCYCCVHRAGLPNARPAGFCNVVLSSVDIRNIVLKSFFFFLHDTPTKSCKFLGQGWANYDPRRGTLLRKTHSSTRSYSAIIHKRLRSHWRIWVWLQTTADMSSTPEPDQLRNKEVSYTVK